ncbi:MAG: hypothetical protein JWM96_783 [Alphaproteobacteria bacterium]|nr:hypothetical protein [Alphaproteobacteria bacterium]
MPKKVTGLEETFHEFEYRHLSVVPLGLHPVLQTLRETPNHRAGSSMNIPMPDQDFRQLLFNKEKPLVYDLQNLLDVKIDRTKQPGFLVIRPQRKLRGDVGSENSDRVVNQAALVLHHLSRRAESGVALDKKEIASAVTNVTKNAPNAHSMQRRIDTYLGIAHKKNMPMHAVSVEKISPASQAKPRKIKASKTAVAPSDIIPPKIKTVRIKQKDTSGPLLVKQQAIPQIKGLVIGNDATRLINVSKGAGDLYSLEVTSFTPSFQTKPETVFNANFSKKTEYFLEEPYKVSTVYEEHLEKLYGRQQLKNLHFTTDQYHESTTVRFVYHPERPDLPVIKSVFASKAKIEDVIPFELANDQFDQETRDIMFELASGFEKLEPFYNFFGYNSLVPAAKKERGHYSFETLVEAADLMAQKVKRDYVFAKGVNAICRVEKSDYTRKPFEPHIGYMSTETTRKKNIPPKKCRTFFGMEKGAALINEAAIHHYMVNGTQMLSPEMATRVANIHYQQVLLEIRPDYLNMNKPLKRDQLIEQVKQAKADLKKEKDASFAAEIAEEKEIDLTPYEALQKTIREKYGI